MEPEEQAASNRPSTSPHFTNVKEQTHVNVGDIHIYNYPGYSPPIDVNSLGKELKSKLNLRANEIVGEPNLPIQLEREITRVKLQITKVLRHHVIYGEDINWKEHMKRRQVPSIPTTDGSRIAINQLFDKAKETATRAAQTSTTKEAKKLYIKHHGNTIGLIGQPGIGKTTTSKMVIKSILEKMILPETEYLFYISIKNVNFEKEVTPLQFLTDNSLSNLPDYDKTDLMNVLYNNPNVVILMDGLDEAAANFSETSKNCPLDRKSMPVDIIKNLFNGTLLPNAKKLVTSRPGQFYQIHPDCRPTFVLEVLGLDQDAIDELGTQICGVERYPAIKQFLKERPNLLALCYVPVNCILIMTCLLFSSSSGKKINSMTQVLIYTLIRYMTSEHLKSNMTEEQIGLQLVKLSQLAFKGFQQQKLVFTINDFKEVNIKEEMANNFMHTYVDKASGMRMKILEGHKRSYFSHLMWQEFLTAVHMMLFLPYEHFKCYNSIFKKFQWEVVARFMFGICNLTSKTDLEVIFPTSEIKDFEAKKKMILDIISSQPIDPKKGNFNSLLGKVSGWMHELDDKDIIKQVEQSLPTNITLVVPSNPTQARDLGFAFKFCSVPHNLMIKAYDRRATSETATFLRALQGSTNIRIFLDIQSEFDENAASCLGDCLHQVSHLRIDEWRISVQSRIILSEAVQQLSSELVVEGEQGKKNSSKWATSWRVNAHFCHEDVQRILQLQRGKIKKLELKGTHLGNVAEYLVPHIQHIDELRLLNCKQLNDRMWDVCTAINDRPNKIKLTVRSDVRLDDHAAQGLAWCICKISELDLDWSILTTDGQLMLQEAIQQLSSPKIKLTVKGDQGLDEHAAQCLAKCVGKISELDLNWNNLSPDGQCLLKKSIQQLLSPKIKLTVRSDGWLSVNTEQCLAGCLGNLSELDLDWSKLTTDGQLMLKKAIQDLPSPQIKLRVRRDDMLNDDTEQCLAGCVGKISELDLDWNKLSPEGQLMLQEAIQQLPSSQIKLTVRSDEILNVRLDDHASQCLAGCVGKISELDLNWNRISTEGQLMLQEAVQQLSYPQIKLTVRSSWMLDDRTAQCLAGCIGKISELDLNWSKLSPDGQLVLREAIQQLPSFNNFILKGHEIKDLEDWFEDYKSEVTKPKQLTY